MLLTHCKRKLHTLINNNHKNDYYWLICKVFSRLTLFSPFPIKFVHLLVDRGLYRGRAQWGRTALPGAPRPTRRTPSRARAWRPLRALRAVQPIARARTPTRVSHRAAACRCSRDGREGPSYRPVSRTRQLHRRARMLFTKPPRHRSMWRVELFIAK